MGGRDRAGERPAAAGEGGGRPGGSHREEDPAGRRKNRLRERRLIGWSLASSVSGCYPSALSAAIGGTLAQPLRAKHVFTPGSFPIHTYVERNDAQLDQQLR